jgi:hypothetical protein
LIAEEKKRRKRFNGHNDKDEKEIAFSFDSFFDCPCCPIWLAFCVCSSCSFSSYSLFPFFLTTRMVDGNGEVIRAD